MDRPLTGEEAFALQTHLHRFKGHTCPVCGTKTWITAGLSSLTYRDDEPTVSFRTFNTYRVGPPERTIPVVVLVCGTCFYVRQFAWQAILNVIQQGYANVIADAETTKR